MEVEELNKLRLGFFLLCHPSILFEDFFGDFFDAGSKFVCFFGFLLSWVSAVFRLGSEGQ